MSAFANFEVGRLIKKKKKMEKPAVYQFSVCYCSGVFYLRWSFIVYKNTRRPCYASEKAYNCPVREFWAVSLVKANGRVGAIPTYRVYRLIIFVPNSFLFPCS